MNKQNPQNVPPVFSAWLNQWSDPQRWQMPPAPQIPFAGQLDLSAMQAQLSSLGASLDPAEMIRLQKDYTEKFANLWQACLNAKVPPVSDRRMSAPAWSSNPFFAWQAATYQLNARFLNELVDTVQASDKVKQKLRFAVQQMIDALSPANFLATNPDAQQKIIDTKGESLARGMAQLFADLQKGRVSQTDEAAFEVGKDVATTTGSVVFENHLFQLIQYAPQTKTVHARPLLIVPPCINKFYILDLQPQNSLVRYTVEQGHTVFLMSWRNADAALESATWEQYVDDAVVRAIHVAQDISGQEQINALGFCVGGTILSCALALLAARGEEPVASLTLLTSFLNFLDTGAIDVYIDEVQIKLREQMIGQGGLMAGRDFSSAFSSLRPNDLLWNYVESNYLKGETPQAFDLLYWNADSTNLPGPMFCYYLRHMYLENALKDPGRLRMAGQPIDLRTINVPAFIYASREDHIVPWASAYASTAILNGKKPSNNRFVLGASGHIAGVINPPAKNKRNYWTNDKIGADAAVWLAGATEHPGSWWTDWAAFLGKHAGKKIAAPRKPGNASYVAIEPAPGRYVKVKAE
jgi:polyhydroxyalkanoate synthase subunit PhaC